MAALGEGTSMAGRFRRMFTAFSGEGGASSGAGLRDIDAYDEMHSAEDSKQRSKGYADLVNSYYNLATDFYEVGWGQSFHFANKLAGESFQSSICRHEYYLAARLGVQPEHSVLDCGCGIGGPLRNIGRFTGAKVVGVTLNQYQVNRGNALCQQAGIDDKCKLVKADFHQLPFADNSFDHCYSIEAICHSPDRADVYREIYRVLKPGGKIISYEWCLTPSYDPSNAEHKLSKKLIEEGDGLPDMTLTTECDRKLEQVGFRLLESRDAALEPNPGGETWYNILTASYTSFFRLQFTPWGTFIINIFLTMMELVGLAPKGSGKVRAMLKRGQQGLVMGGEMGCFTPMYLVYAQKPL